MDRSFLRSLLLIIACFSSVFIFAQQISKEAALWKAQAFLSKDTNGGLSARRTPRKAPKLVLANDCDELFIFNDEVNGGYVIVSGDERMPDVLGYTYDGHFDANNVSCNLNAWLEGYAKQINLLRTNSGVNSKSSPKANSSWNPISPMIECKWGHWTPYNNQCPERGGEHTASGCVAIAMAQVMFYHKWPKQTTGIIPGYTTNKLGIVVPDTPVTTIDWENMKNYYSPYDENSYKSYTKEQADAVATLMKLCNVAVEMDFGLDESGAYASEAINAFLNYFDYDSTIDGLYNGEYEIDEWNQIVYDELSNGRPVMSADGGHAFVIDGYDKDNYFHMNFGEHDKVQQEDGYFLLSDRGIYLIIIGIQPSNPNIPHAYALYDEGKLSFYYDKEKENRSGEIFTNLRWYASGKTDIEECVFDSSFANVKLRYLESFFENCKNLKTIKGLNYLNTSEVKTMRKMFCGCSSLESLDLSNFNTEKVINMVDMFSGCSALTSLDVSSFNTKNVEDMSGLFYGLASLATLDISHFNTEKVTKMANMFCGCSALTSLDVSSFNTKNVEDMGGLFYGLASLTTLDVSNFDTKRVKDMGVMFQGCSLLKELDLRNFDTSNVYNMGWMFGRCNNLTNLNVSGFRTDNVQNMGGMFYECFELKNLNLSGFNTESTTNMRAMFCGCHSLESLDLSGFNTEKVQNMGDMFFACSALEYLDLSHFNTDNVTNMHGMFGRCESLRNLNLKGFNTGNVTDMGEMFSCCSSLEKADLDGFNTENVTNMGGMFSYCNKLTSLDLSCFNTMNVTNMLYMFSSCKSLTDIYVSEGWKNDKVEYADQMFDQCYKLVGEKGTTYDENHIGLDYAHIDGGPENPGYFTYKKSTEIQQPTFEDGLCPAVYSLSGIKVHAGGKGSEELPAGVYIVGGKKVVLK